MLARANMYRICTPTLLLVHYIPHTKYASRSSSRPQGLYMPLAKLCKAFAGAEDSIPCSQTRTCQRCCQCDYSSIGTVATWANRPGKKRSTTAISQQQKIKEEVHGLLLSTNRQYVYLSLAPVDNSVPETLAETE